MTPTQEYRRGVRAAVGIIDPSSILTAIAAALDRLSKWIGRSQAERAKQQQPEIDRMDAEIQGITKEQTDAK